MYRSGPRSGEGEPERAAAPPAPHPRVCAPTQRPSTAHIDVCCAQTSPADHGHIRSCTRVRTAKPRSARRRRPGPRRVCEGPPGSWAPNRTVRVPYMHPQLKTLSTIMRASTGPLVLSSLRCGLDLLRRNLDFLHLPPALTPALDALADCTKANEHAEHDPDCRGWRRRRRQRRPRCVRR